MTEIRETRLPGVGVKFTCLPVHGGRLAVIQHNDGMREIYVFRRPADIPPHVEDLLAARPRAVWFQSGIRHDAAAERLARAGIKVVQDRCLMVEHRRARYPR